MAKRSKRKGRSAELLEPEVSPVTESGPVERPGGGWRIASIFVATAGLVTSLVITYIYFRLVSSGGTYHSFCAINAAVNCDDVLTSPYGKILGIPVSVLGIADYILLLVLLVAGTRSDGRSLAYALLLTGWNLVFSASLAIISATVLHQLCLLCAVLYAVNLALPVTVAMARNRPLIEPLRWLWQDIVALPRRPALLVPPLVIVGVGFIVLFASLASQDKEHTRQQEMAKFMAYYQNLPRQPLDNSRPAPARGSDRPRVNFVEFSDFQCPHCSKGAERMKEVLGQWGDKVRLTFRNYPLDNTCNEGMPRQIHENACRAAVAAQCAFRQGKFWEYHDLLFANQTALQPDDLLKYARQANLQVDGFQSCLRDPHALQAVREDIRLAESLKVDSTPSFFINGRKLAGAHPLELYGKIIELELQKGNP